MILLSRLSRLSRCALAIFIVMLSVPDIAPAQVEEVRFETAQQESLYGGLISELRCLVCANQSLSDSNSGLAKDLRGKVRDMVRGGQGGDEIIEYMTARYGEYVLYRPRFSPANFFLWFAPFAVALGGLAFIWVTVRGSNSRRRPAPYPAAQLLKARALLEEQDQDQRE